MGNWFWKNPPRALERGTKFGSAFLSKSPKAALSLIADVKNFFHTN